MSMSGPVSLPSTVRDRMRRDLRVMQSGGVFDVLFGGAVAAGELHLTDFSGTRSKVLRGLVIEAERGAGGRAMVERRPVRVDQYRTARSITHDYVREIVREGIQALVAAPIIVNRETRGVLYGALRHSTSLGDRPAGELERAALGLGYELAVQDEVELRLRALAQSGSTGVPGMSEAIAENYVALREIARDVEDPALCERIRGVEESLRALAAPRGEPRAALTAREADVLTYAGLGLRYAEIGDRLCLTPQTVKTYMRNLMVKLGVRTRHAAVVEARRQGLVP